MSTLELRSIALGNWTEDKRRVPQLHAIEHNQLFQNWKKTVPKTPGWIDQDVET
jgi:hypothetical protein